MDGEGAGRTAAELAKAFQELSRGEQTAASMEAHLDGIESKIDQLLAAMGGGQDGRGADDEQQDQQGRPEHHRQGQERGQERGQ
ncbi:hypothetical protein KEM52_002306 [Ascosphaera acerosa]|nr:hypothetical protein KEM52_002306 [Ascosphaera acerosa]